jgi:hypothetical protein
MSRAVTATGPDSPQKNAKVAEESLLDLVTEA